VTDSEAVKCQYRHYSQAFLMAKINVSQQHEIGWRPFCLVIYEWVWVL